MGRLARWQEKLIPSAAHHFNGAFSSYITPMSKPFVVSIPHRLGKVEALARLKSGFTRVRTSFSHVFTVREELWTGDHLQFQVSALGQMASGTIDVAEDHVRLEVTLPWLLAAFAEKLTPAIRKEGTLLLEKK